MPETVAALRSALQEARLEENRFAAAMEAPDQAAADDGEPGSAASPSVPAGAVATEGGWFTEVMLAALEQSAAADKYDAAARLKDGGELATGPVPRL
jgi:hypothetical protein